MSDFKLPESIYTAIHKCIRCGQCAYGNEEIMFQNLCPLRLKGEFFTNCAGGIFQISRTIHEERFEPSEDLRDLLYSCTACGVCELNCSAISDHIEIINLVKDIINKKGIKNLKGHNEVISSMERNYCPYSGRIGERSEWLSDRARKNISKRPEVFYFSGCVSSYRETDISISMVNIFQKLDIPYSISEDEWCCGAPLFYLGREKDAHRFALHNLDIISASGAGSVVFTCPTCSMIFKKYYGKWTGKELPFRVLHVSEFLEEFLEKGLFNMKLPDELRVIYHDPCHLGRGQGIYDAPRKVLNGIEGLHVHEFKYSKENSFCCGGGGLLPAGNPEFSDFISKKRIEQIGDKDISAIVSSCPGCKENLKIALKKAHKMISAIDLTELVYRSFY